jgi:predicted DNA-binding transcriptional regulator YafY
MLTTTHQKVLRLLEMVDLLRSRPRSPAELSQALQIQPRTVFRYLADLKDWRPDLQKDDLRHTYSLPHSDRLTDIEALVTHSALRLLCHHTPGYNRLYLNALEKLGRALPPPAQSAAHQATAQLRSRQDAGQDQGRSLELVALAWFGQQVVRFDYLAAGGSGQPRSNEVEIYFLEVSRSNLGIYLIGYERSHHRAIRSFKLNRIQNIVLHGSTGAYSIPDHFDPLDYLEHAWGIVGSKPVQVTLRFSPQVAYRLQEETYPGLELSPPDEQGFIPAQITVGTDETGFPIEILPWIQSWGPRVEVLAPQVLRQRWLEEAHQITQLWQDRRNHHG